MADLNEKAREILGKKSFAHVATLMDDGSPQVTPVWVEADGDQIVFNTARDRLKDRNLRRDPRVAISASDPDDPYAAVVVQGRVAEITEEGADEHADKMAKKYMGVDEYPFRQEGEVRLIVRIDPEKVSTGQ